MYGLPSAELTSSVLLQDLPDNLPGQKNDPTVIEVSMMTHGHTDVYDDIVERPVQQENAQLLPRMPHCVLLKEVIE